MILRKSNLIYPQTHLFLFRRRTNNSNHNLISTLAPTSTLTPTTSNPLLKRTLWSPWFSPRIPFSTTNSNSTRSLKVWEIPVDGISGSNTDTNVFESKGEIKNEKINGMLYHECISKKKNENCKESKDIWETSSSSSSSESMHSQTNAKLNFMASLNITNTIQENMLKHFLPTDYPNSVDKGYKEFASYCFLANVCGSTAMVLSTQTLLLAVGVGSASSAPMAGALNWVMKDGIGQLGGVLFASRITSNATGNTIDKDPKRWRMVSALSMDGATLLEICSPLVPGYFLPIASIANIGKNIGFLTASASRAALHQSLAMRDNLGDITAKAGSQSIAASLVGTGVGICLSPLIGEDYIYITTGFICLSSVHQFCTYKSLKAVALKKLNRHRLVIALDLFLHNANVNIDTSDTIHNKSDTGTINEYGVVLSPDTISKHEKFIPFLYPDDSHKWLQIGCSLMEIANTPETLRRLMTECLGQNNEEKYILNCNMIETNTTTSMIDNNDENPDLSMKFKISRVMLTFHDDATDTDIIRGMFHAYVLYTLPLKNFIMDIPSMNHRLGHKRKDDFDNDYDSVKFHAITASHGFMNNHCDSFLSEIKKWWEIKKDLINVETSKSFRIRIDDKE